MDGTFRSNGSVDGVGMVKKLVAKYRAKRDLSTTGETSGWRSRSRTILWITVTSKGQFLGEYGGGAVMVWDRGFWDCEDPRRAHSKGKLDFTLEGEWEVSP